MSIKRMFQPAEDLNGPDFLLRHTEPVVVEMADGQRLTLSIMQNGRIKLSSGASELRIHPIAANQVHLTMEKF